jgi:hypothetical protein
MAYRLRPGIPLVMAKDQAGTICYHYAAAAGAPSVSGPVIPWLGDEQREHFLRNGLVEELPDGAPTAAAPAREDVCAPPADSAVENCSAVLEELGVPSAAGAPAARRALRESGRHFGNDVIAHAVRGRKTCGAG